MEEFVGLRISYAVKTNNLTLLRQLAKEYPQNVFRKCVFEKKFNLFKTLEADQKLYEGNYKDLLHTATQLWFFEFVRYFVEEKKVFDNDVFRILIDTKHLTLKEKLEAWNYFLEHQPARMKKEDTRNYLVTYFNSINLGESEYYLDDPDPYDFRDDFAMIDFLIAKGANVQECLRDHTYSAFHQLEWGQRIIESVDFNTVVAPILNDILANAPMNIPTIQYLMELGADIHYRDDEIFVRACSVSKTVEIARYLLAQGANPNAQNGKCLLMYVKCIYKNIEFINELIKAGANVNVQGGLPLCAAIHRRQFDMVQLLVRNGADVNAHEGLPYQLASVLYDNTILKYLVENGATEFGNSWSIKF